MPRGIPISYLHCGKCEGKRFKTVSDLRRHQWAKHTEMFDALKTAARKAQPKALALAHAARRRQAKAAAKALVKLEPSHASRGPMLASELLAQLQVQHRFLSDVVSLISGIISQREENK